MYLKSQQTLGIAIEFAVMKISVLVTWIPPFGILDCRLKVRFVWISRKYVNISFDTWADKITGLK